MSSVSSSSDNLKAERFEYRGSSPTDDSASIESEERFEFGGSSPAEDSASIGSISECEIYFPYIDEEGTSVGDDSSISEGDIYIPYIDEDERSVGDDCSRQEDSQQQNEEHKDENNDHISDTLSSSNCMEMDEGDVCISGLEEALNVFSQQFKKLLFFFILLCIPGFFNVWHLTSYVFLGQSLVHTCHAIDLEMSTWTTDQIRNITLPRNDEDQNCFIYDRNYTQLSKLTFSEARLLATSEKNPKLRKCENWIYEGNSIVSEWNLVCDRAVLRSSAQMFVSLGKFLGAIIFGFIADRWGRKKSFVIACICYMVSGPIAAVSPVYTLFISARFFLGLAGSGTYNVGFTLLTELCSPLHRSVLGILYNMSYPVGMMILSFIAYYERSWRNLQLIISVPALILLLHCWFLPESPRWLLSQGYNKKAEQVIKDLTGCNVQLTSPVVKEINSPDNKVEISPDSATGLKASKIFLRYKDILNSLSTLTSLFGNKELRHRLLICYYTWFVTAMTYYGLTLNAENFTANRYSYVLITGLVEATSTILLIPLMRYFGRKCISAFMYFTASVALISILFIPREMNIAVLIVAMIGRLCIGAVYAVIVLHTSELYPTVNRNFAVGTSSTMSHLGSLSAPYVVDLLGAQAWYIPSTICGVCSLFAGFIVLVLPETKEKKLCDTIEDVQQLKKHEKVSFHNCCSF